MLRWFHDMPIKGKLIALLLATATVALFIVSITYSVYDWWSNWQQHREKLITLARITGMNTAAAITFSDPRSATDTLQALAAEPSILAAYVLTPDGHVFAQYRSPRAGGRPDVLPAAAVDRMLREAASETAWTLDDDLETAEPIVFDGDRIGMVIIQADTSELAEKIRLSLFFTAAVAILILFGVYVVSFRLQRIISQPILQLADTMRSIAKSRSFSGRMVKQGNDEIGTLYDGFNDMLKTVQERTRELRESEDRFRALVESTNDWIWEVDEQGRYTYASPRVQELLGYESREVIGRTPFDLMPPEEASRVAADFTAMVRARVPLIGMENVNLHKDGHRVVLETSGIPIVDAGGGFKGYRGIDRDITSRKQAEQKIRELMREQQAILETSAVGVSFVRDRKQLWTNPAFRDIFGYSQGEVDGLDAKQLYADAGDYDRIGTEGYALLAQGENYSTEVRGRKKDGTIFWLQLTGRAINRNDLSEGAIWIFQDITDRRRAQEALRESEGKYRLLVEAANSVILTWDTAGTILFLNEYGERFFGFSKDELIGRSVIGTIVPAVDSSGIDLRLLMEDIQKEPERFMDNENENMTRDGRRVWVRWANKAILDGEGRLTGILSIGSDITARRQAEAALREKSRQLEMLNRTLEQRVAEEVASRARGEQALMQQSKLAAMGEMLGAIAHQWRQPLNALAFIVQNLKDAHAFGELDREYIENAVQKSMAQIQHMSATIENFRNFFRPDRERTAFDAMRAVGEVLSLIAAQLSSNNISYRLTCHTHGHTFVDHANIMLCPEMHVEGYQNEFEHVILNIISNAQEAILARRQQTPRNGPEQGLLTFDFHHEGGTFILDVGDNGGGIPDDILGRIFEPYFTTKAQAKGTGLGLYMSKVIIEDHMQGTLAARNEGQGAVVRISLPQIAGGGPHDRSE